jgi:hypothetical protein
MAYMNFMCRDLVRNFGISTFGTGHWALGMNDAFGGKVLGDFTKIILSKIKFSTIELIFTSNAPIFQNQSQMSFLIVISPNVRPQTPKYILMVFPFYLK